MDGPAVVNVGEHKNLPFLAQLILEGGNEASQGARRVTDFVYESPDITKSFLVLTNDGNVVIGTGVPTSGPRHKAAYAEISSAPTRYIILPQSHGDHMGGVPWLRQAGTEVVAQANFDLVSGSRKMLAPYWKRRNSRLLDKLLKERSVSTTPEAPVPTITFEDRYEFELGDRRFVLLSVPGGETLDCTVVWLPDDGILFTANMFGPIIGDLPNLYTIRGERIRSAKEFIRCVDLVLDLKPELVIQGHGLGSEMDNAAFRDKAVRVRDATQWLHDRTIEGMNAGKDLHELMREISLPLELYVPERHGKVLWCVRAIWEEYVGWFDFRRTSSLYGVPAYFVHPEVVEMAGGADAVAERARRRLDEAQPLEALHLAEMALDAEPDNRRAWEVILDATSEVLVRSGQDNFFEVLWLDSCIEEAKNRLNPT